jgi:hypothetical protein
MRTFTQPEFYEAMAVPVLTYAGKSWTKNLSDKMETESAETGSYIQ